MIFKLCPWIIQVGDWALRWTEGNEMLQVFFVMLFFPVVMNALQYYIIDGFIQDQKPADHEVGPSNEGEEDHLDPDESRRRSESGETEGTDDGGVADKATKDAMEIKTTEDEDKPRLRVDSKKLDEYDPTIDGEGSGSSGEPEGIRSSSRDSRGKAQEDGAKES